MAAIGSEVEGREQMERGVVEVNDEKEEEEAADEKDIKVLETDVKRLSL